MQVIGIAWTGWTGSQRNFHTDRIVIGCKTPIVIDVENRARGEFSIQDMCFSVFLIWTWYEGNCTCVHHMSSPWNDFHLVSAWDPGHALGGWMGLQVTSPEFEKAPSPPYIFAIFCHDIGKKWSLDITRISHFFFYFTNFTKFHSWHPLQLIWRTPSTSYQLLRPDFRGEAFREPCGNLSRTVRRTVTVET